jgi:vacuolar-type H+-ATPase subunit E/Vma4
MQHAAEHFGDQELVLIYIAKQLKDALRLETVLTEAGLDYLVEPDKYSGGLIFQSERVGAFFYVAPADEGAAKDTLSRNGFQPYRPA